MREPYGKAVTPRAGPEPWRCVREDAPQASVGVRVGWVWSRDSFGPGRRGRSLRPKATPAASPSRDADGLHRRAKKMITDCGDFDATYRYTWDRSWRLLEMRDGSGQTSKQKRGLAQASNARRACTGFCGRRRPHDEHSPPGARADVPVPASAAAHAHTIDRPRQNANFNPPSPPERLRRAGVIGLTDADGVLVERYEYTPYGQRTVYKKAGLDDTLTTAPLYHSQPATADGQPAPYALCDIGHQGLMHERVIDAWDNRLGYGRPMGRWPQRDLLDYPDGMSLYAYLAVRPIQAVDPLGKQLHHWIPRSLWTGVDPVGFIQEVIALFNDGIVDAPWHHGYKGHSQYITAVREALAAFLAKKQLANASKMTLQHAKTFLQLVKTSTDARIESFLSRTGVRAATGKATTPIPTISTGTAGAFVYGAYAALVTYVGGEAASAVIGVMGKKAGCCRCLMTERGNTSKAQTVCAKNRSVTVFWTAGRDPTFGGIKCARVKRAIRRQREGLYALYNEASSAE